MQYVKLGNTGLKVSRLCLGCMTYGEPQRGKHPWTLDEAQSRPLLRQALDMGINFFDTANSYSDGSSEEIVGRALRDFVNRDEVVIATKVYFPVAGHAGGLSRKAIMREIDASLRRLGTDYVDLYQIHRWDDETPIEETLEALNDVVRAGKARYIGASSMHAWQFARALFLSEQRGWARFVTMQNHYNLIYREEEREMLGLCADQKIGVLPWSPLARGKLTRDWDESSHRAETDEVLQSIYRATADSDRQVVQAVADVAAARGVSRAQVALAWLLHQPAVTAPIIGASRPGHLQDAQAALALKLDADEIARLEAAYVPHPVAGFTQARR
ncbi:aldo/keto reductase [Bordetella pseudohinzii]|uniref:Alcohol dehydrogenase n=1 Tax=Bordetella pseudohinzii TaxID=1331258 RepID=A0A0J6BTD1_9BORD|nr:aldo/keto reductase [Bordetella pseudohinzii]ANY15869.1 alcohol dehydrogenase [Bordetella pseudohinzii]KMM25104.1 alcohol dehydrogenase [Bordetella pseudohinzii]KXA80311.1 alcohol dehydrogenase [Bordetella pseudohinzii]KXA81435.1 alcohol dehydrogenase [Bordetella pseudohinzii]CUI44444.1 General stress protein 69 [Bordetella pseudohinzii]